MIDVDCVRRNYSLGHFDPGYMIGANTMMPGICSPHIDPRVLVHWNQPSTGNQLQSPVPAASAKSDEDEDESEERPFTPPPPRERLSYTRYQLELLNGIYEEVRYPNSTQKQLIAKRVGITREQVKIWFQNRRRKDVIGNSGKPKSCDTSTSSTCSSGSGKESDQQNSPPQNSPISDDNGNNSSDENSSQKEAEQSVVPSLVMKSVIGELIKFTNDPLKGKKKRKKAKSKLQEKSTVKKGLTATLLTGAYDMISPPNQITPTAFFEKIKNGFSHSKNSSAFAVPGDVSKPSQICSVSSTSETGNGNINSSGENAVHISRTLLSDHMASNGRTYPTGAVSFMNNSFSMPAYSTNMPTELPVLTDILSYKSSLDMRAQNDSLKSAPQPQPSSLPSTPLHRSETNKPAQPSHMHPFTPGRSLNGIFPYPFMAEPSMMLSSLRQTDHIFRPAPHYPVSHYSNDPYQPLFITSLSNPYYSPPTAAWNSSHPVPHSTSSYTQL